MPMILVIEDELTMTRALQDAFEHHGYSVKIARNGEAGLRLALSEHPDLILLDVMLPGQDGFDVCRLLRADGFSAPIVMLTARSEEVDRVVGLEIGADDYVTKPFSMRELVARVKAHLRRASHKTAGLPQCSFGDVHVDFSKVTITRGGRSVPMTSTEWSILQLFAEHRNEVVTREQILNHVWGYETYPDSRTVDTHVLNLRHKLEVDPRNPRYILTVHGLGYKFIGE
jgi:DNA-binding response OmpR family regulator